MTTPSLPRFAELPGASLPIRPPFPFEGMSARVFPLRASLESLQRFVDSYLNIIPPELGRFRVSLPYVYLIILDYGKMAIEVGNYGWLAQREILFNVSLEWYEVVDGTWRFRDWASFAPYIYVDDDLSMTIGRTVYGWPKTSAHVVPVTSDWVRDPQAPVREALVQTSVFSELYADKRLETQTLLEIEREAPPSAFRIPAGLDASWMPWTIASRMVQSVAGFGRDATALMGGLGIMPMHPGSSADNYLAMINRMATSVFPLKPSLGANTINLKQFRRSEDPGQYCYQAVTNGVMRFTKFNGGGLLGEDRLLCGDSSGGYAVTMPRWPSLPIIDTLGIEVDEQWRGTACDVATLKPVLPFWYNVNMVYEPGWNVAWRSREGTWRDREGRPYPKAPDDSPSALQLFNTALGPANRTIAGPFRFENTTIRVLPLLAWKEKLSAFVDATFNATLRDGHDADGSHEEISLWGPTDGDLATVYLAVTSIGDVASATDNIGDWADYELAFLIPVRRERVVNGERQLLGVGVVQAFTFVDNPTASAAYSEVLGITASASKITVPENSWMHTDGPAIETVKRLLQLEAEVLPVVGQGEKSQRRELLTIEGGQPTELRDARAWRSLADTWGDLLKSELVRKKALAVASLPGMAPGDGLVDQGRALALEILGNQMPVSVYSLKQFRDVAQPDRACYQSVVRTCRTLTDIADIREIEQPLTVRIHEYPTQPMVQLLGLIGEVVESGGGGVVYALQPQRPFWLTATVHEALGENVRYRSDDGSWAHDRTPDDDGRDTLSCYLTASPSAIRVGVGAARILDQGDARRLVKVARDWHAGRDLPAAPPSPRSRSAVAGSAPASMTYAAQPAKKETLTPLQVEQVLRTVDPQTIIDSVLSREWGNWNESARWRVERRACGAQLAARTGGISWNRMADEEQAFFKELIHDLARRPGTPPVNEARVLAEQLRTFTSLSGTLEEKWQMLSDLSLERSDRATAGADPQRLVMARLEFLESVKRIEATEVLGQPADPEGDADADSADNHVCLHELVNLGLAALARAVAIVNGANKTPPSVEAILVDPSGSGTTEPDVRILRIIRAIDELADHMPQKAPEEQQAMVAALQRDALAQREPLREMVRLARERCALQRAALLNNLSRAAQRPDFVIWRGSVGTERDRIFPSAQSWDEHWYVGSPVDPMERSRSDETDEEDDT